MSSPGYGEVWLVDLGYVAKVRPCLVVSIPALIEDMASEQEIMSCDRSFFDFFL